MFVAIATIIVLIIFWTIIILRNCAKNQQHDNIEKNIPQPQPIISKDDFPRYWKSLTEWRRRRNAGNFVMTYNRPPTETEIITGDIQNEKD